MAGEHINMLEMRAVARSLQSLHWLVRNRSVLIQTDNTTKVSYINRQGGTKSPSLCLLTLDLFRWCANDQILLKARHLPGVQNALADDLSRGRISPTEWGLHRGVVSQVFLTLGRPNIDLFASRKNTVLPTFCTRFPDPMAWATNALTLDWTGMHAYVFPPISLLRLVLAKVEAEPCKVLLIAPFWPRQFWFTRLVNLLIAPPRVLPEREDLLTQEGKWFPRWLVTAQP